MDNPRVDDKMSIALFLGDSPVGQTFWNANSPSGSRSDLRHPSATTAVMRATPASKASSEIAARSEYVRDLTFDRYSLGDSATGCSTV
jgi:hypothetical protein